MAAVKELEDTKEVTRICKSKKDRQHNYQNKKDKQRYTKHTHKNKVRVARNPLKTGDELLLSGRVGSSCSTSDTRRVTLVTNPEQTSVVLDRKSEVSDF